MPEFICNACGNEEFIDSADEHEPCSECETMMDRVIDFEEDEDGQD